MTLSIENLLKGKKILIVGAHPDDIELGMGATLWKLRKEKIEIQVFSSATNVSGNSEIEDEFWKSMNYFGTTLRTCLWQDIPTMEFFRYENIIKNRLYYSRQHFKPDIVFSTSPESDNLDHSVLGKCVANVFQESTILYYEDIRGGSKHKPDVFVGITPEELAHKIKALKFYKSQNHRKYFNPRGIESMATFGGTMVGLDYAESYQLTRVVF